jgi:hypothetical protein
MKIGILVVATVVVVSSLARAPAAQATVMGIGTGSLIKLQNDSNPATHEDEAVYYLDADWKRRPFPNSQVYMSWYRDFSGVQELTASELSEFRMGTPIVYRPGTRLIKIQSVPKVYAVEPGGVLRWITSEDVAKGLYGVDWAKRVDDVSETFFINYREGAPLTLAAWPTGSFVRSASDPATYHVSGLIKRKALPEALAGLRVNDADIIMTSASLGDYAFGTDLAEASWNMIDTSQQSVAEPLPAPLIDFPAPATAERDGERVLCSLRLSANTATMIKQVRVRLTGSLWNGGTPQLTDLRFTDANGEVLFGVNQLEKTGSTEEILSWSGAYSVPAGEAVTIDLWARPAAGAAAGSSVKSRVERSSLVLAESGNGSVITNFLPKGEFTEITTSIK